MKTSIKALPDISGLHDVRTYTGVVRKSSKPDLPTTAILDLYMRRNEKDRLEGELQRLRRRKGQLHTRLQDVEKEMTKLLNKATQTAVEIRGSGKGKGGRRGGNLTADGSASKRKGRMILGY